MDQSVSGENFTLPAGTKVFLGAPANPMDAALVRSITELVVSIPAVLEAHLPQCHIPGIMQQSAQILVNRSGLRRRYRISAYSASRWSRKADSPEPPLGYLATIDQ
jgi:hypothetical protein